MPAVALCLLLSALLATGCGGSDGDSADTSGGAAPAASARPQDFPKGGGLTFQDVRSRYPADLSVGIGASLMSRGTNRVPFLVLDKGARPVRNAPVALYTMRGDGTGVRGPFVAREQPFGIKPAFLSRTTSSNPDQEEAFYVADVRVAGRPPLGVFGLVRLDGRLVATSPSPLGIETKGPQPPDVGDRAISVHTETIDDVSDVSELTTRTPPNTDMLQDDLADVLGRKPVVLVFATPALCQSRVCGPDVDVALQVSSEVGDRVSFIHQEIYVDNEIEKGLRPQVRAWRLQSEPWAYVIDRNGRIVERIEGAVSVPELRAAVDKVV